MVDEMRCRKRFKTSWEEVCPKDGGVLALYIKKAPKKLASSRR